MPSPNVTKLMRADDIAHGFNGTADRKYWRATVAGTRVNPEVNFNSRASMVQIVYRISTEEFVLTFNKANAAFGDYLSSGYRSLEQVLAGLKAAGLPFRSAIGDATLRLEYNPLTKDAAVYLANLGDPWPEAEILPFKVPERKNTDNEQISFDPESTADIVGLPDNSADTNQQDTP